MHPVFLKHSVGFFGVKMCWGIVLVFNPIFPIFLPEADAADIPVELVEPDETIHSKPDLQTHPANSQPVERMPMVIDEPGFKARATFPEKPIPHFDQDTRSGDVVRPRIKKWTVPQEEGVDPSQDADESEPLTVSLEGSFKEAISPALAQAIAKERKGKKAKEMVAIYQELANQEPDNAATRYRLGLALTRNGELLKGLAELEKALVLHPENPKYHCDYGLVALQAGWLEKALTACQTAAFAVPANARYQSAVGDCLLAAKQMGPASEAYIRSVNLDPNNPGYIYNLGMAHLQANANKRAIEIFDEAIRLRPAYSPYYCSRGLAYENSKNIKLALENYAFALKLDKDNAYAHFLMAGVYSDSDDPTHTNKFEAMDHAEKAVKLTEYHNPQYLMGLARALRVARNYEQAVVIARKAIELEPREDYRRELGKLEQMRSEGSQK